MVTHDMREAFTLASRVVAFERRRDRPEEKERYGATIQQRHFHLAAAPCRPVNDLTAPTGTARSLPGAQPGRPGTVRRMQ